MREAARLNLLKVTSLDAVQVKKKTDRSKAIYAQVSKGSYAERLLQAGLSLSPQVYLSVISAISLFVGYVASFLGVFLALYATGALFQYLALGYVDDRAAKRRKKVIPQFPAFVDSLAASLGTGFNLEGAVIQAAQSVPPGLLRTELDKVVDALQRGYSLEDSVGVLRRRITGKEVTSMVVCLQLFQGMGGRLLEPFKRLGRKIRDQQQVVERANRDLVQVKQAFAILMVLSFGAPAVLILIQPDYLVGAFEDSMGRIILQAAVIIQITSLLIFKKITGLKI